MTLYLTSIANTEISKINRDQIFEIFEHKQTDLLGFDAGGTVSHYRGDLKSTIVI